VGRVARKDATPSLMLSYDSSHIVYDVGSNTPLIIRHFTYTKTRNKAFSKTTNRIFKPFKTFKTQQTIVNPTNQLNMR